MAEYNYKDAYKRHPIGPNQVAVFENGSMSMVYNVFDPLPAFMHDADLVFVDPPWTLGNLNCFYTKAGRDDHQKSFQDFYDRLFAVIAEIGPKTCYIEIGKDFLAEFLLGAKKIFRSVTFYNSSYYHRKDRLCYVIRASNRRRKLPLDGMDEEDIIQWVCANEEYECIGDPCVGLGLVAINAYANNRRFVVTELNHKRLSFTLERLATAGLNYEIQYGENDGVSR